MLFPALLPLYAEEHSRPSQEREAEGTEFNSAKRLYDSVPETVEFIKDIEFGKGGGKPLHLTIARPKKKPSGLMPAVVYVHGGGWRANDKDGSHFTDKILMLAENGFFAVSINYRLSGEAGFPSAIEDTKCAVRFVRAHAKEYQIDPTHIGAWGESAGGHLVALIGTSDAKAGLEGGGGWADQSSRVQAVVDYYGPADFLTGKNPGST